MQHCCRSFSMKLHRDVWELDLIRQLYSAGQIHSIVDRCSMGVGSSSTWLCYDAISRQVIHLTAMAFHIFPFFCFIFCWENRLHWSLYNNRYVEKVPLAAEMLDVRRSQKIQMIKDLNIEKARFRFEVEIGKSPPLSDEEFWSELREKAWGYYSFLPSCCLY